MSKILSSLHRMILGVAPIYGVSIGRWDDKSTWRIDFKDEATEKEIAAGYKIIQEFDHTKVPDEPNMGKPRVVR